MYLEHQHEGVRIHRTPSGKTAVSTDLHGTLVEPAHGIPHSVLVKHVAQIIKGGPIKETHLSIARRTKTLRLQLERVLPLEKRSGPDYWKLVNRAIFGFNPDQAVELSHRLTTDIELYDISPPRRAFFDWLFGVKFPTSRTTHAIVSNSDRATVMALLAKTGMSKYFEEDCIFTPESFNGKGKQSPGCFRKVFETLHVQPENAIYFGNSLFYDLWAALEGADVVWFRSPDESLAVKRISRKMGLLTSRLITPVDQIEDARRIVDERFILKK